ncbi:MAG: hypothetical protein WBC44_08320 [Planctomycetaceae bacterium]
MATVETDRGLEDPCPSCGAMVRRGLVRCWSCGAFMRQDIAAKYERMQQQQPEVAFQPLPERSTGPSSANVDSPGKSTTAERSTAARQPGGSQAAGGFAIPGLAPSPPPSTGDFQLGAEFAGAAAEEGSSTGASAFSGGRRKDGAGGEHAPAPADSTSAPDAGAGSPTAETPRKRKPPADGGPAHSVATAGDVLLQVALQEEQEAARRGRGRRTAFDAVPVADGWMITCPCPARIRIKVKEAHRGKTGKCPNPSCGSYFTVPADLPTATEEQPAGEAAAPAAAGFPADPAEKAGLYTHWLRDVRLHVVKPAKAKRKPGGHEKDFRPADLGFSKTDGVVAVSLTAKPAGMLALSKKKPEQIRDEILAELRAGKPVDQLPCDAKFTFEPNALGKLIVESPPAYEHESTFAGIPVFGEGRIAVKLPPAGAPDEQHFVSLTLSQYRRLQELLDGLFEVQQFGLGCPIPRADDVVHLVCHYSDDPLTILRNPAFHLADPETPLEPVGYRCESCGLIVSEASRRKEKIGGLDGKKLAGAKCPKCKGKFGNSPLYALKPIEANPDEPRPAEDAPAAEEPT